MGYDATTFVALADPDRLREMVDVSSSNQLCIYLLLPAGEGGGAGKIKRSCIPRNNIIFQDLFLI